MIKNIFYILTIILSAATAFFGFSAKKTLEETTATTIEVFDNNGIVAERIEEKDGDIKTAKVDKKTAVDNLNETTASLENESSKENGFKSSLGQLEAEVEGYDAELQTIDGAIATAQAIIQEMVAGTDGNLDVDAVVGHIERLKNERKDKELELESKTQIAGTLATALDSASARKENLQDRLGKVKNRIALNKVTASVTGVSNEYGFVIISRGANNSNICLLYTSDAADE